MVFAARLACCVWLLISLASAPCGASQSSAASCTPGSTERFGRDPGFNISVECIAVFDDGSGPALYITGSFNQIGTALFEHLARWDGTNWSTVGFGLPGTGYALASYNGDLILGGDFNLFITVVWIHRVGRWNGTSWSPLGAGFPARVRALHVSNGTGGPTLHAAGDFTISGGATVGSVARWNGVEREAVGGATFGAAYALASNAAGDLYAAGTLTHAGGQAVNMVAKWTRASVVWSPMGNGIDDPGRALLVHDFGAGERVYLGGEFGSAGTQTVFYVAQWDGASWSSLGSGMEFHVLSFAVLDEGYGPQLYAAGLFAEAGGYAALRVARWNGSSWGALGIGLNSTAHALVVFDDGGGEQMYVGGNFTTAGGVSATRIARWNGSNWSALGSGISGSVRAMAVFDDGGGDELYAAGILMVAGGQSSMRIAKWDGTSWSAVGTGLSHIVYALATVDAGDGEALYAGGEFSVAGGHTCNRHCQVERRELECTRVGCQPWRPRTRPFTSVLRQLADRRWHLPILRRRVIAVPSRMGLRRRPRTQTVLHSRHVHVGLRRDDQR